MNWNRLQTGYRIFVQLVLVISLITVTFFQFLKLEEEIANVSISYNDDKRDLELPSITFCPQFHMIQENMTFQEYMEHVLLNASDFFELDSNQGIFLPGER